MNNYIHLYNLPVRVCVRMCIYFDDVSNENARNADLRLTVRSTPLSHQDYFVFTLIMWRHGYTRFPLPREHSELLRKRTNQYERNEVRRPGSHGAVLIAPRVQLSWFYAFLLFFFVIPFFLACPDDAVDKSHPSKIHNTDIASFILLTFFFTAVFCWFVCNFFFFNWRSSRKLMIIIVNFQLRFVCEETFFLIINLQFLVWVLREMKKKNVPSRQVWKSPSACDAENSARPGHQSVFTCHTDRAMIAIYTWKIQSFRFDP